MKHTPVFPLRLRRRSVVAALALAGCLAAPLVATTAIAAAGTSPRHTATAPRLEASQYATARLRGLSAELAQQFGRTPDGRWLYAASSLDRLTMRVPKAEPAAGRAGGWNHGRRSDPAIPVGNSPQATALDPATHTLYEANGNDNTLSVINTATCNAVITISCGQTPPTVQTGSGPVSLAVDQATDTIYVANANDNTVSVINGAICNAKNSSGCGQTPPTVAVGSVPVALDVNQATDTVYVADWGNGTGTTVSVVNGATCNGQDASGCGQTPASVTIGAGPDGILVDQATDTVYAATVAPDNTEAVWVINGATCNATTTSGCAQTPPSVSTGYGNPGYTVGMAIDHAAATLYVTDFNGNFPQFNEPSPVSMIDTATCNATVTSSCGQTPHEVVVGAGPTGISVDVATQTVYVSNNLDWTVSAVNAATCNAVTTAGCGKQPAGSMRTGREPGWVTVDPATGTVYTPNSADNTVSVLNGTSCNAAVIAGCTAFPPTVPVGSNPLGAAVNDATHTLYVTNLSDNTVSVINSSTCNGTSTSGCRHSVATVTVGNTPILVAVNQATDTIYVANGADNTVSVIDGKTCNASVTTGCSQIPPTIAVPGGPGGVAVNQATDTVYISSTTGVGTVAVINGASCNATVTSGCGQTPPIVTTGYGYITDIAVDEATNTVYTSNGNSVSVIDGKTCNGVTTTGCSQTPQTATVAALAGSVAVDQHTDTVYVADTGTPSGYGPGAATTVSMINGATCNATVTSGCSQTPPTFSSGNGPDAIRIDQVTDTVYIVNFGDYAVVAVDGRSCDATDTSGCQVSRAVPVGGAPAVPAVSQTTGSVYLPNGYDNNVSVLGPQLFRN
jgi:YVTN family beta-propeller protein